MCEYRFAKEKDLEELSSLYRLCFPEMVNSIRGNCCYRDNILVATIDNVIVGMVTLDYLFDNFLNEKYVYINNLCVHPDYQGKGIGMSLMETAGKMAKDNSCKYIKLTSNKRRKTAHKLYNKLGFEVYDTVVFKKNI